MHAAIKRAFRLQDRVMELRSELIQETRSGSESGPNLIEALDPNWNRDRQVIDRAIEAHDDYEDKIRALASQLASCVEELEELKSSIDA